MSDPREFFDAGICQTTGSFRWAVPVVPAQRGNPEKTGLVWGHRFSRCPRPRRHSIHGSPPSTGQAFGRDALLKSGPNLDHSGVPGIQVDFLENPLVVFAGTLFLSAIGSMDRAESLPMGGPQSLSIGALQGWSLPSATQHEKILNLFRSKV